jgi:hypothetical protein
MYGVAAAKIAAMSAPARSASWGRMICAQGQ